MSRVVKRTKVYSNLEDTRPTIQNKPSGLKSNRHHSMSASAPYPHSRSSSSSSITTFSMVPWSPVPEPDHSSSLLAISPPSSTRLSVPTIYGNPTSLVDEKPEVYLGHPSMVGAYLSLILHTTHCLPTNPSHCHELRRIPVVKSNSLG